MVQKVRANGNRTLVCHVNSREKGVGCDPRLFEAAPKNERTRKRECEKSYFVYFSHTAARMQIVTV